MIADSQAARRVGADGESRYEIDDFKYNEDDYYYECPQGKRLNYKRNTVQMGIESNVYQASLTDCKQCPLFLKCSWSKKEQSKQVHGKTLRITEKNKHGNVCWKMLKKFETVQYQDILFRLR